MDLSADDARIGSLADRLWHRAPGPDSVGRSPIRLELGVETGPARRAGPLAERWTVTREGAELTLGDQVSVSARLGEWTIKGRVHESLLERAPGLVARLALEAPVAILLQHRGYAAVHGAAVAGPRGAVVIRAAPGAGKSTLAAAAYLAGLDVLGDESILVARDDPDQLLAAVRDPTLEPGAVSLLGLTEHLSPATERPEAKQRMELFATASPSSRLRVRLATVILGPRTGGPARLERLDPVTFAREFRGGAIREERWAEPAPGIARAWARDGYRLSGAADLAGAVGLLAELTGHDSHRGRRA